MNVNPTYRWSLIAGRLPGRTDNEIKNYWNSYLAKKAKDQLPSAWSITDKNPVIRLHYGAEAVQRNGARVTPQLLMEDQNHDYKLTTRPSMGTNLVKNKSELLKSSAGRSPSSTSEEEENTSNLILDFSSEDFCRMLDSDFAKLSDVNIKELKNAIEGDDGPDHPLSEEREKNLGGSEGGQANNYMVSNFQPLFLESDDGWLGDDIDIFFSDEVGYT